MAIRDHSPSLNPAMPGYSGQILFAECISKLLKILLKKKKKKTCSKQASALITLFKLHSHPARSHYVTEERLENTKRFRQLFQGFAAGACRSRRPGSLGFGAPVGTRGRTPAHGGVGARRPQPAFHPARTSAVAALPLPVGKSLRRGPTRPSAPPRHGGRLSAQTETRTWT